MMSQKFPDYKVGDIVRILTESGTYDYSSLRCFVEEVIHSESISLYSLDGPVKDKFGYSRIESDWYVGDFKPNDLEKIGEMSIKDVENYEHYVNGRDKKRILDDMGGSNGRSSSKED